MNKETINKLVPKLRFPEFRDSGEWKEKTLKQVANINAGQSPKGASYNERGEGIAFFQGKTDFGDIFLNKPTKWTTEPTKFANAGDILMSVRAPVGVFNISNEKICIGRGLAAVQPTSSNKWYLYFFLNSIQNKIIGNGGSVFDSISKEQIEKIEVLIPPKLDDEQKKIADCLFSLNEIITTESQKLEILKDHKKGLMQKLFPAEGETVPKFRFPEFKNNGEWKEKSLGNMMPITSCRRVHQSDWTSEGIPFYRARDIVALKNREVITPLYISKELYNENVKLCGQIIPGDLLVTGVGTIGVPYLVKNDDKFYFKDGNIIWLKNDNSEITGEFLYLLYESDFVQRQISKMAGVGTVGTYTIDNAKNTVVVFPNDKEKKEQQKIVNCFSSIDDLITAQNQKIEALKQHKKGLMQQLFPNPK